MSAIPHRILSALVAATLTATACMQQAVKTDGAAAPGGDQAAASEPAEPPVPDAIVPTPDWRSAVKELKLKNGMTVLLRENHAAPVVTWMVCYRVGSRNEGPGTTGSAHLLEHMMFKGTHTFQKGQIAGLLGRNGASFNATTNPDFTNYFETYSSDRLDMGLAIEASRMRDSLILDAERKAEMTVVRNELERQENSPGALLQKAVQGAAFRAHPYHHPVIGYRSDVEGVSTNRLRAMYDTYYHPNNAVAILVGDFHTPRALQLLHQYFDAIPAGPSVPEVYTSEEPQIGERRVRLEKRGNTNLVSVAYHIPEAAAPDTPALALTEAILSHGLTSRLHRDFIEGGLATGVSADAEQLHDPGLFWLEATLRPGVDHARVEEAFQKEVDRLRTVSITPAELQRAKNQAEASYALRADGTTGVAWGLGTWAMEADWSRFYSLLDDIRKVSAADIQDVARRYFTPENRTVGWFVGTKAGARLATEGEIKATSAQPVAPRYATQPWEARPASLAAPGEQLNVVRLPNNLTVAVLEDHSNNTVSIDGWVRAGSILDKAEPTGRWGRAALTATLLDKGTAKRTKARMARDLESVGASLAFGSGSEVTSFRGTAVSKDTGTLVEALFESLMTPAFPQEEFDLAQNLAVARVAQADENPAQRANRILMQKLYPEGHPFYPPSPAQAADDYRALAPGALAAYHKRFFGPNNTALAIVGDVNTGAVIEQIRRLTANWSAGEVVDLDNQIQGWSIPPVRSDTPFIETMLDKSNVEVRVGFVAKVRRKDRNYYPARVMNYILGGSSLTSRLGVRLRDELGLTYGTGSSLGAGRVPGPWIANITLNRANVAAALKAFDAVVDDFRVKGPTADDVADARSALIGAQAVSLAGSAGKAASLADVMYYGLDPRDTGPLKFDTRFDPRTYWPNFAREVGGVTLQTATAAARSLLNLDSAITVIAGPYDLPGRVRLPNSGDVGP